jgi:DNA modification methylase
MKELYYGDNLEVLRRYIKDESVDLCYIDPPFNSKRNYNQIYNNIGKEDKAQAQAFIDTWEWDRYAIQGFEEIERNDLLPNYQRRFTEQSRKLILGLKEVLGEGSLLAYLISMTLRIVEIHRVLKPTGSFYLHCDPSASHYLKIIIDAIFCAQNGDFLNEIIWCYRGGGASKTDFGRRHDVIFRYSKSKTYKFNADPVRIPYQAEGIGRKDDAMWGKHKGTNKVYKPNALGKIPEDWWLINVLNANAPERLGYPTQKPAELLERIIYASSDEGDIVLDAYCGCGTTVSVAERSNRKWIGIDITYQSISLILRRLEKEKESKILDEIIVNGIPKDLESAELLANKSDDRTRKEFEKWAVLTYSNNRGVINEKKGADKGIDGFAYFEVYDHKENSVKTEKIVFQVKSGKVKSGDIRDLRGTMEREKAVLGVFITLKEPTKDMLKEAIQAGTYQNESMSQPTDKIRIVTAREIIEDKKRLDISQLLTLDVVKSATKSSRGDQLQLGLVEED